MQPPPPARQRRQPGHPDAQHGAGARHPQPARTKHTTITDDIAATEGRLNKPASDPPDIQCQRRSRARPAWVDHGTGGGPWQFDTRPQGKDL